MLDLHVHSYFSDGELSPRALVRAAKGAGLEGLALTDHDTLAGLDELEAAGREFGLTVHGGVEISCAQADGRQLHLLAYDIPAAGRPAIETLCRPIRQGRNRAVMDSVRALARAGYPVDEGTVLGMAGPEGDLCKQYVMQALMDQGLCGELYGPLYRRLFKRRIDGAPGIAALRFACADPFEALACVKAAGAKAVLAHPGQYDNFALLPALAAAGLWGVEAHHPKHDPQQTRRCLELAARFGLAVTGGSDAHGRFGEGERLGERGVDPDPLAAR